jgi:hypothetical protein
MRRESRLIALGVLALLASALVQAQPQRTAAVPRTAPHSRASHTAPRGPYRPAGAATAPLRAAAATALVTHAAALAAPRIATVAGPHRTPGIAATAAFTPIARTNAVAGAYRTAVRRRAPVNAALGGPATFDARKLVRR